MLNDSYTRYPRPILWLVRGGRVTVGGEEADVEPFYIGKFPVTNEQFEAFDPDFERVATSDGDRDPAAGVAFEAARAYCQWYAEVSRKPMRLPTEVEWEYACRGGGTPERGERNITGDTFFGDATADDCLWHAGNSDGRIGRLDAKQANDFGLYGMLGGVWEWTLGDASRSGRQVLRGGSFRLDCAEICCSLRRVADTTVCSDDVGFRIVKSFR